MGACNLILYIHVLINWQLSKQCFCWPVSPDRIAGSGIDSLSSTNILKVFTDKLLLFKWSQAQVHFFFNAYEISCVSWAALLKCWFRTDLGHENSTGFYIYMQGGQSLLTYLTVTRWSRSTSNFYVLIGQNLTGEFMRKTFAASGNLLTDSWSWESFVSSCDVINCLFLLGVQNEIQLLWRLFCKFVAVLFIALFVDKCTACQSHWKSDFGWHRFQKWAYSLALAWGVRRLKSLKRFWNTWWPSEAASRLVSLSHYCFWCFFFGFLKSSVWFMRLKLKHEQWSNLQ